MDGQLEGDDRPVAPADHVRLHDAKVVEQSDDVGGHLRVDDRCIAPGRAALAAAVHRHDPIAGDDQHGREVGPPLGVGAAAVEQQHQLAVSRAVHLVVEGCPVDRCRLPRCPLAQRIAALRRGLLSGSEPEAAAKVQGGEGGGVAEDAATGEPEGKTPRRFMLTPFTGDRRATPSSTDWRIVAS